jgi:hypothetical protein
MICSSASEVVVGPDGGGKDLPWPVEWVFRLAFEEGLLKMAPHVESGTKKVWAIPTLTS